MRWRVDSAAFEEEVTINEERAAHDKSTINDKGNDVGNQRFKLNEHRGAAMLNLLMPSNIQSSNRTMTSGTGF